MLALKLFYISENAAVLIKVQGEPLLPEHGSNGGGGLSGFDWQVNGSTRNVLVSVRGASS